jgi:hypothetical protein
LSVLIAPRHRRLLTAQGFGKKALGRCGIAFGREKEVDRRTSEMRRRKKATKNLKTSLRTDVATKTR